jgi:glutamine amidotransferase
MKVAIIEYNAGNTQSVAFALERLGIDPILTSDMDIIASADAVIFPGVGAAGAAMAHLRYSQLDTLIPTLQQPVLGICLGMQLLCAYSEEDKTECLGIIPTRVSRMVAKKVPHIGWNQISELTGPLFNGIAEQEAFYFVHSFSVSAGPYSTAKANYEGNFSAAVQKENFYGVQFHPEKSGPLGLAILENFISLARS